MKQPRHQSTTYGFSQTSRLLQGRIRTASEARGFAVTRLLTHWDEIVGQATAQIARPVNVSYGREGMGATLTILTTGSQAPMLEMQKEQIREKVNACYGYRAISRVRITQTAPTGLPKGKLFSAMHRRKRSFALTRKSPMPPLRQHAMSKTPICALRSRPLPTMCCASSHPEGSERS